MLVCAILYLSMFTDIQEINCHCFHANIIAINQMNIVTIAIEISLNHKFFESTFIWTARNSLQSWWCPCCNQLLTQLQEFSWNQIIDWSNSNRDSRFQAIFIFFPEVQYLVDFPVLFLFTIKIQYMSFLFLFYLKIIIIIITIIII